MQKLYITSSCQMCSAPVTEIASNPKDVKQKIEEYNAVVRSAADNDFFPIIYNDIDDEDHRDIFIVATYTTTAGGQLCDSGESGNILILVEMTEDFPYCMDEMEISGVRSFILTSD
jgi:hypothetical protein